jgi:hypothetical protein
MLVTTWDANKSTDRINTAFTIERIKGIDPLANKIAITTPNIMLTIVIIIVRRILHKGEKHMYIPPRL